MVKERKLFIGIDPGQAGAIGVINLENDPYSSMKDIPLLTDKSIDFLQLYFYLKEIRDINFNKQYKNEEIFCVLEKAQTMPKQGIKGAFSYGRGYQAIIDALTVASIPFIEVHPAKWKKLFSLNQNKKRSIMVAQQLFPDISYYGDRGGLKDGRAEAILLAEYGRQLNV